MTGINGQTKRTNVSGQKLTGQTRNKTIFDDPDIDSIVEPLKQASKQWIARWPGLFV